MRLIVSLGRKCWREDGRKKMEEDSIVEVEGFQTFSYKELDDLTGGFSDESQLGKGGWGIVYKAKLKSGIEVAIKRMKLAATPSQVMKSFKSEIINISKVRHRNLIKLLGYCHDSRRNEHMLVYDLATNGNLEDVLFASPRGLTSLTWPQKLKILAGAADGLVYLHQGLDEKIIHRDIKCANILLDEEWNAKLGDFGLSRAADHQGETAVTDIAYTPGYIAPEIVQFFPEGQSSFSDKSDIFAFGVVILEVACGRRVAPRPYSNEIYLVDLVRRAHSKGDLLSTVEKRQQGYYNAEQMEIVLKVGFLCIQPNPQDRPSMRTVAETLREILGGDVKVPLWQLSNEAPRATAQETRQYHGSPSPPPSFTDVAKVITSMTAAAKVIKNPDFQHFQQPPPPSFTAAAKVTKNPDFQHFQQPPPPSFTAAAKVTKNPDFQHFQQPLSPPFTSAAKVTKKPHFQHFQQPPSPPVTAAAKVTKNPDFQHFQQPPPPSFTAAAKVTKNPDFQHFQQPPPPSFTAAAKVTGNPHYQHFQQPPPPSFTAATKVTGNPHYQHFQQPPPPSFTAATKVTGNPHYQHFQQPPPPSFTAATKVTGNPHYQHFQQPPFLQPPLWFSAGAEFTENPHVQHFPQPSPGFTAAAEFTENPRVQHVQQWNTIQDPKYFTVPHSPKAMIVSFLRQYLMARALQRLKYQQ